MKLKNLVSLLSVGVAAVLGLPAAESDYYRIVDYPASDDPDLQLEICAMTMLADGNLMVGTRLGDIFYVENALDPAKARFTKFAHGLNHPLGLLEHKGAIYLAQRGELTRLRDENGDHVADSYETVCDKWAISGNYHEFNFGPRLDPEGYMWVTLNKPFGGEPYGRAPWRGYAVRIHPETGEMQPMSAGLRSPCGIENAPWGDMFYTDNQGEWCNASKLAHLEFGDFHGHPHGLEPTRPHVGKPFSEIPAPTSGTWMKELKESVPQWKMPALWFPYDKMGKSPSGLKWDQTGGRFGPFKGQLFVGDQHHSWLMRCSLEKVKGHWQGACFLFREGFQCGILRMAFASDGSLFVGMSNAGWGSRGNKPWGLQRLVWSGKTPLEIHAMKALKDGFELTFTKPVDRVAAADSSNYTGESYTYQLRSAYGGPEDDKKPIKVESARVAKDGLSVRLKLDTLRSGYVHELHLQGIQAVDGDELLHRAAYYTLVNIPD
jgi:glucose/arabinose dehydrogenase